MTQKIELNIPTKLRKPPNYFMTPEEHRARAQKLRLTRDEDLAHQHEMVARMIEVAIVKRGAQRVAEGSEADQEMERHLPGWRALLCPPSARARY